MVGPGRFTLEIDYIHKNKTFFIYSLFSKKSILKKLRIDSVSSICVSEWALSRSEAAFGGSASLRSQLGTSFQKAREGLLEWSPQGHRRSLVCLYYWKSMSARASTFDNLETVLTMILYRTLRSSRASPQKALRAFWKLVPNNWPPLGWARFDALINLANNTWP